MPASTQSRAPARSRRSLVAAATFAAAAVSIMVGCSSDSTTTTTGATGPGDTTTSSPDTTEPEAADTTEPEATGGWEAEFVGAVPGVADDGARIINNFGEFENLDGSLVGTVTFSAEGQIGLGGEAEIGSIACLQVEVELADGMVAIPDGADEVEVAAPARVNFQYRACPPSIMAEPEDYDMTFDFEDDMSVTGSFLFNETRVEFTATPA